MCWFIGVLAVRSPRRGGAGLRRPLFVLLHKPVLGQTGPAQILGRLLEEIDRRRDLTGRKKVSLIGDNLAGSPRWLLGSADSRP